MSCPRHDETLAWVHGVSDDDSLIAHIAACEACTALVEETELVAAAVSPVAAQLEAPLVPANRPRWPLFAALAAAAAVLLTLGTLVPTPPPSAPTEEPTVTLQAIDEAMHDELDAGLDDLDQDLDALLASLENS